MLKMLTLFCSVTTILQLGPLLGEDAPITAPTVVTLVPPVISLSTIAEEITCTRSNRNEICNISEEKIVLANSTEKKIINCYGFGGSGWTTLFGAVDKAIALYEKSDPDKKIPIRVIGSGCVGLTSAIELTRRGFKVEGITTKNLFDIPSWKASGYFGLVDAKASTSALLDMHELVLKSFLTFQTIERGEHPYIKKDSVRLLPTYCSKDTNCGLEDLATRKLIPAAEQVNLDFGNGVMHENFLHYMTYFMDVTRIMQQLTNEVKNQGIKIEVKEIQNYDEIAEPVIFNCAGLGGKELNKDQTMVPVRGYLVALNSKAGSKHMDYMIYTQVKYDGKSAHLSLCPKTVCVSGKNPKGISSNGILDGTFLANADQVSQEKQEEINQEEFMRVLDCNSIFFTGKPYSEK